MREHLIEQSNIPSSYIKSIPLTESTKRLICEGKEYSASNAYDFPVWRIGVTNKNGRIYPQSLVEKIIKENKITVGLSDHPEDEGSVKDICMVEKNPHIKNINGEKVMFVEVYLVGPHGKGTMKDILEAGGGIGTSSSAYGEVGSDHVVETETYELERYCDHVLNPSMDSFGFAENKIGESTELKEEVKLGSKIKWNDTNWIVEKFLDDNRIEARKANQDHIYHEIPIKEIQEVIFESKKIEENFIIKYKNMKDENKEMEISDATDEKDAKEKFLKRISAEDLNYITSVNKKEEKDYSKKEESIRSSYGQSEYMKGLELGKSGKDLKYPEGISKEYEDIFRSGYLDGKNKKEESIKKNTTGASMNKKFSVEEKMFRKSIENQIKECEAKIDMEDKIQGYTSILEWFDDTYKESSDLKEKVEKAIQEADKKIKEFAKKGLKTDTLEETQKKLVKEQNELTENYKSLQEKYDLSTGILDTLKDYSKKMKDLYENQKARSNGMVEAKKFKECLKTVEALSKALKEKDNKISILENSIKKLNEDLSSTKKVLDEKVKLEKIKELQKKVVSDFNSKKQIEESTKIEKIKLEESTKEKERIEEAKINFKPQREEIKKYYEDIVEYNPRFSEFKEQICSSKTMVEAQKLVIKLKDLLEDAGRTYEFKDPDEKLREEVNDNDITRIKRKGWL